MISSRSRYETGYALPEDSEKDHVLREVHTLEIDHGSTSLTRYGCPQTIAPLRVTAKDKKLCAKTS
jgi:hypothetical protein